MTNIQPLIDSLGRVHTSLRISITDRCNIRCFYCMPDENVRFLPRRDILRFEEIERFVEVHGRQPEHGENRDIFERLYEAGSIAGIS